MSTPQVKAPTKKAFHFPKGATEAAPAPAKRGAKASKKTAKPAEQTEAAATTPKTAKKPAAKAPVAKKAGKTPTVEAAAAKKTEKTVASQPNADAKARRVKKEKVVRDSFTMPKSDYAKIAALKEKCQKNGVRVKKSELLRAALAMLDAAPEKRLVEAIKALETVKTGRPANA
ncbi:MULTISPECIES: hypothetical protein [unclassified Caballeronia]|jgi:cell wall-associated NlpC family hydrolase|uniref:hypothetical protein n=1 Tax=unclassified Caballeronia TaxID=2646786 RepID=UPI00202964C0|nr:MULTISPECIES: hypothetical protein [unclassified Caballeronia]